MVALLTFLSSLAAELITRAVTGDETVYQKSPYPLAAALLFSAVVTFVFDRDLQRKETNKDEANRIQHRLFFIPLQYWSLILLGCSVLALVVRLMG